MPETTNTGTVPPKVSQESHPLPVHQGIGQEKVQSANSHSVCWNCEKNLENEDVCPSCIRVQPFGSERDYYSILDVPEKLMLDPRLLVTAYHEKSRTFHPDHHVGDSDREQSITLANASLVNLAFRTLRDPFSRARYFLGRLKGETGKLHRKTTLSPGDLMGIMDLKEELEATAKQGGTKVAEHRLRQIIDPLEIEIFSSFGTIDQLLEAEGKESAALKALLSALESRLEKRFYLHNLLKELGAGL
jgi:molecular chaperone HscB